MDRNDDGTVDYWEMKDWKAEKHTMSFHNAMLWALASLFEQGAERHPKSWSGRRRLILVNTNEDEFLYSILYRFCNLSCVFLHVHIHVARIAAAAWWIGALIIIQSYTANLAAFLTIKTQAVDIASLEDLVNQAEGRVRYGTVKDSHVHLFFEVADRAPYK